jgi:LSD1 subclass zinc finger protein
MRNMKSSFIEKIARFMAGRNGMDSLNKFIFWFYVALLVINLFLRSFILSYLELVLVGVYIFRTLSRNIWKRQEENRKYLIVQHRVAKWLKLQRCKWTDRKAKVYRKCPSCKRTLRLPRTKGKHEVNCPVCHHNFHVKV